jgi:endonuclease/exonuclease/phosphatase (EEP) superfamily protein YafD
MTDNQPATPRRARAAFDLPAWGLAAATLAGFAGRWHWLLDLASHFRWYWLLATLVWFAVTSRRRSRLATACLVIAVGANLWAILPYWLPVTTATATTGDRLTIVSLNLLVNNPDKASAIAYLRQHDADVVVLLEVDDGWADAIAALEPLYPYRVVEPHHDPFGLAVLSKLPLTEPRIVELAGGSPAIITGLPVGKAGCLLMAAHPLAPISADWSARRDAQLAAMGELARAESRPVIVAGDLNTTPWGYGFRKLAAPRGLRDSCLGRGVQSTWHARHWAPRIPIDHVVVSPDIGVESRTVGPNVGSDHLPVEATLIVP